MKDDLLEVKIKGSGNSKTYELKYNLLSAIEFKYGSVPGDTKKEKLEWLRENVSNIAVTAIAAEIN